MDLISTDTFNSRGRDCVCVKAGLPNSTAFKAWTTGTVFTYTKPSPKVSVIFGADNLHFARPKGKLGDHLAGIVGRAWLINLYDHMDPAWLRLSLPHREFTVNVRAEHQRGTYRAFVAFREHSPKCTTFFREVWGIGTDADAKIRLHTPPALDTIDRVDYTRAPRG